MHLWESVHVGKGLLKLKDHFPYTDVLTFYWARRQFSFRNETSELCERHGIAQMNNIEAVSID